MIYFDFIDSFYFLTKYQQNVTSLSVVLYLAHPGYVENHIYYFWIDKILELNKGKTPIFP